MIRLIILPVLSLLLTACVNSSTVITGEVAESIDFEDVKVYYENSPGCEFDVIAHIEIPGEYYNRASLIDGFRQKAAVIGAPAVVITHLQQVGSSEYFGSARAIRCTSG